MIKCYCISGLGADETVFKFLTFPKNVVPVFLNWLPVNNEESLEAYAERMNEGIEKTEPFLLLGLSMGGMIAVEIAKINPPRKLILISSITTSTELPKLYKLAGKYGMNSLLSPRILKNISVLKKWFAFYQPAHRDLLIAAIRNADDNFINWAIPAITHWNNIEKPLSYIHIHGTKDNVLPASLTHPTHLINAGRHFMIVEKAEEISSILEEELKDII